MKFNRNEHSRFVQLLDRTAERNPLLWLPCILLLVIAMGAEQICGTVRVAFSHREKACADSGKINVQLVRKPFALRVVAMTLVLSFGFMALPVYNADVYAYNESGVWNKGYAWHDVTTFATDSSMTYNGGYSIKISNNDYNDAYIEKTFDVSPNTRYKFSTYIKYDNFSPDSGNSAQDTGASIGISGSYSHSEFVSGNTWKKVEYCFDSKNNTQVTLCLRNGMYGATCKGTAWFSDVKLEKNITPPTNEWNVLAVVFKQINASVTINGVSYNYNQSLDDTDVNYLTGVLNNLYTSFDSISGGLMKVKKIDVVGYDGEINSLGYSDDYQYTLDTGSLQVKEALDYYMAQGEYNQIIAISPIRDIAKGWGGLGGGRYNDTYFCQINYKTRDPYPGNFTDFPDAIFVHEMLHCMEFESGSINPNKTAGLHDNLSYGFTDIGDEWRAWYTAYMRGQLSGGKGLDPSVYWVYNDTKYELVSNDMSVGTNISQPEHVHLFDTKWNYNNSSHWHECTLCHAKVDEAVHTPNIPAATAAQDKFCVVCNYLMETSPNNQCPHNFSTSWSADSSTHWHECILCHAKADEMIHIPNIPAATTTQDKICTICGYVMERATGTHIHDYSPLWKYDRLSHWHECILCSEKAYFESHIINSGIVTVQPTAYTSGTRTYSCIACGYVMMTETIAPTGDYTPTNVKPSNPRIPEPIVKPEDIGKYPVLEDDVITEDITVKVKSKLKNLSGGGAHIESKKKYFSDSAIVLLSNTENAQKAAERAVENISGGIEHNIVYPFDISVYNANTNEKMKLRNDGYITFEIAVPKSLSELSDSIRVYHIDGGEAEPLISEIVVKNNITKVRFTATDFSPYMFTAFSEENAENVESGAGAAETSVPVDMATPITNGVSSPMFRLPRITDYSPKKRRYRILRKRKLDDLVFVF